MLRALHFYDDDRRAVEEADALEAGDFDRFLALVNASGISSSLYLQNTWSIADPKQQAIPMALAIGRELLEGTGAIRVHGGGFAGTIQAFVPVEKLTAFKSGMEKLLGTGHVPYPPHPSSGRLRHSGLSKLERKHKNMAILVLGGAGYIGSHTVYELIDAGRDVVVADNLLTGFRAAVHPKARFYQLDIRDRSALDELFTKEKIEGVIHFAASSQVGESMSDPLKYYDNNLHGTMVLLQAMVAHGVDQDRLLLHRRHLW